MKKILSVLAIILSLSLVAISCSNGSSGDPTNPSNPETGNQTQDSSIDVNKTYEIVLPEAFSLAFPDKIELTGAEFNTLKSKTNCKDSYYTVSGNKITIKENQETMLWVSQNGEKIAEELQKILDAKKNNNPDDLNDPIYNPNELSVPTNLTVVKSTNGIPNNVHITWDATPTNKYILHIFETSSLNPNDTYDPRGYIGYRAPIITNKTEYDIGLSSANKFSFYIASYENDYTRSAFSEPVTFQLEEHVKTLPMGLKTEVRNGRAFDIGWDDSGQHWKVYGKAIKRGNPETIVLDNVYSSTKQFSAAYPGGYSEFHELWNWATVDFLALASEEQQQYDILYLFVTGDYGKDGLALSDYAVSWNYGAPSEVVRNPYLGAFNGDTQETYMEFTSVGNSWTLSHTTAGLGESLDNCDCIMTFQNPVYNISGLLKDAEGNTVKYSNVTNVSNEQFVTKYQMQWDSTKDYYVTLTNSSLSKKVKLNFSNENFGKLTVSEIE